MKEMWIVPGTVKSVDMVSEHVKKNLDPKNSDL